MPKPRIHPRIIQYPFAAGLQGARLESYREEMRGKRLEIVIDYQAFERHSSELSRPDGKIIERVTGQFVPSRVRFSGVLELKNGEYFKNIPEDARTLGDLFSWRQTDRDDVFHMLIPKSAEAPDLTFFAHRANHERLPAAPTPVSLERDWCPPPSMPAGLVPMPRAVHARFGGDPVTVWIGSRPSRRALFIGGTDIQPATRPSVDFVLNLGEEPSKWAVNGATHPGDRWDNKGEGSAGMSVEIIRQEAEWVIERLRAGQRGLVHCVAGMNRSSTIYCAVLIFLEGLSAEAALARVRETHPWARPDSRHWLALRWLAQFNRNSI
jgi:hypothetical protein